MSLTTQQVYRVFADLTLPDGSILPYQDISSFQLVSMNQQEVDHTTEGSFEGLFDFNFTEFKIDLKGDWVYGQSYLNNVCRITAYARFLITRSYTNNSERRFEGYLPVDVLVREELTPGFYKSTGTVVSYATMFKETPLGKISTYENRSAPQETFSLYRKTIQAVPFDVPVPGGVDPQDLVQDVDIYIQPDVYLQEGSLLPGDKTEFERVTIFDTKTLSRPIDTDTNDPFYKELPTGYHGDTGTFDGWYSYDLKHMPVVSLSTILEHALECVNKKFDLTGTNFPRFRLGTAVIPQLVHVQGASLISGGVWHCQAVSIVDTHGVTRVIVFVWTNQFSVSIYEITNGVQLTLRGNYSWSAPSLDWITQNSKTGHIGDSSSGIGYDPKPGSDWATIDDARARNPQAYNHFHPDGTLFARVFGASENKIYFGWSSSVKTRAAYNNTNQYRAESSVWVHAVSFDVDSGEARHDAPTFSNGGQTEYYSNGMARRTVIGIQYTSPDDFYYGNLEFNQIQYYVPLLSGVNSFEGVAVPNDYFTGVREWIRNNPVDNPLAVNGYSRSAYSLFYIGPLLADKFSLFLEDKKASDLIMLVCKLTNSAPVITYEGGNVVLGFRQRPVYDEANQNQGSGVPDYILNNQAILAYNVHTENFLKDDDINIQIDLDNVPDALQKAFQDFYRYKFMPKGLTFHLINVPMTGPLTPPWLTTIAVGNKVGVQGRVLEYLGTKDRELDGTLILMER